MVGTNWKYAFSLIFFSAVGIFRFAVEDHRIDSRSIDAISIAVSKESSGSAGTERSLNIHNFLEERIQEGSTQLDKSVAYKDLLSVGDTSIDPGLTENDNEWGTFLLVKAVIFLTDELRIVYIQWIYLATHCFCLVGLIVILTRVLPINATYVWLACTSLGAAWDQGYQYALALKNHWIILCATVLCTLLSFRILKRSNLRPIIPYFAALLLSIYIFSLFRTQVLLLILTPLYPILASPHLKTMVKAVLVVMLCAGGLLIANSLPGGGHGVYFPMYVGLGEGSNKIIPAADDGYAFIVDKQHSPYSAEWHMSLRDRYIESILENKVELLKIVLHRLKKVFKNEEFSLLQIKAGGFSIILTALVLLALGLRGGKLRSRRLGHGLIFLISCACAIIPSILILAKKHSYYFIMDLVYIVSYIIIGYAILRILGMAGNRLKRV